MQADAESGDEMFRYVLGRLYRPYAWSIAISSKDIFYLSARCDVFHYALYWELSNYARIVSFCFFFVPATTCVMHVSVSVGSVVVLYVVGGASLCL